MVLPGLTHSSWWPASCPAEPKCADKPNRVGAHCTLLRPIRQPRQVHAPNVWHTIRTPHWAGFFRTRARVCFSAAAFLSSINTHVCVFSANISLPCSCSEEKNSTKPCLVFSLKNISLTQACKSTLLQALTSGRLCLRKKKKKRTSVGNFEHDVLLVNTAARGHAAEKREEQIPAERDWWRLLVGPPDVAELHFVTWWRSQLGRTALRLYSTIVHVCSKQVQLLQGEKLFPVEKDHIWKINTTVEWKEAYF